MSLISKLWNAIKYTIREHRAPRWLAEPIRTVANRVAVIAAGIATILTVANQWVVNIVPVQYHARLSGILLGAGAVLVIIIKYAAEIARSKVFSPATHVAAVQQAVQAGAALQSTSPSSSSTNK